MSLVLAEGEGFVAHVGLHSVDCSWVDVDDVSLVLGEALDWNLELVELLQGGERNKMRRGSV